MDFAPLIPKQTPQDGEQVSFDNESTSTYHSQHRVGMAMEHHLAPKISVPASLSASKLTLQAHQDSQNVCLHSGVNTARQRSRRTLARRSDTPKSSGNASDATDATPSSLHSLQYSLSHGSQERGDRHKHGNVPRLKKDAPGRQQVVPKLAFGAAASDDDDVDTSISILVQERLLDRLDLAAIISPKTSSSVVPASSPTFLQQEPNNDTIHSTPSVAAVNISTGNILGKKKSSISPPHPLPPKMPRKQEQERRPVIEFDHQDNGVTCTMAKTSENLKQFGERVLEGIQGGEFLSESYDEYNDVTSATSKADLPRKLLERLEAATADDDENFMADHHDQDPPLQMARTTSFESSTIASAATSVASFRKNRVGSNASTSLRSHSSATRKSASCSLSGASRSTTVVTNLSKRDSACKTHDNVSAFIMSAAEDWESTDIQNLLSSDKNQVQRDRTTNSGTRGAALTSLVDEADVEYQIIERASNQSPGFDEQKAHEEADQLVKLMYLYSQDKEFENSILTSSSPAPGFAGENGRARTSCQSPRLLYRSEAIDSFWDQANCPQNINYFDTNDHKACTNQKICPSLASSFTQAKNDDLSADAYAGYDDDDADAASIVSEKLLNLVTSGCTGVTNPAAKEAMAERLVALEAGWSGFRTQVNERIQYLEESWRSWNLDSLLKCPPAAKSTRTGTTSFDEDAPETVNKPVEGELEKDDLLETGPLPNDEPTDFVMTPTTSGSSTLLTAPPGMSTSQKLPSLSRHHLAVTTETMAVTPEQAIIPEDLVGQRRETLVEKKDATTGVTDLTPKAQKMQLPSIMTVEEKQPSARNGHSSALEQQPAAPLLGNNFPSAANNKSVELKIMIGSTEQDVPVSLRNSLAEISMIAESRTNASHNSSSSPSSRSRRPKSYLDSSREDSEGGQVMQDAVDWDPVNSTDDESVYGQHAAKAALVRAERNPLPPFANPTNSASKRLGSGFFFRRRKSSGSGKKKKNMQSSPTSVMAEV
jgi:hypothetical protein